MCMLCYSNTIEDEKLYLQRCTLKRFNAHLFCAPLVNVSVIGALVLVKFLLLFYYYFFFFTKQSILDVIRNVLLTDVM